MKYLASSFTIIVITFIYLFTIFNSNVLGELGNMQSITPAIIVLVLFVTSITLSIIGWKRGANRFLSALLIFLGILPFALLIVGGLAQGMH